MMVRRLLILLFGWIMGSALALSQNLPSTMVKPESVYFPLNEVRLLDSPFLTLQQKGKEYLLWLNPDSLLHFYRVEAGLPPKADAYAGWESQNVWGAGPLRGGFLGFYLSSVSMMHQSTGDKELLKRLKYVLKELKLCQDAGKDGFLLGIKDGRMLFKEVASGKIKTNNPTVNGAWAPVYLINKMLLGLSAAYTQCGARGSDAGIWRTVESLSMNRMWKHTNLPGKSVFWIGRVVCMTVPCGFLYPKERTSCMAGMQIHRYRSLQDFINTICLPVINGFSPLLLTFGIL